MPLTAEERGQLVAYIWQRACEEHRSGQPCVARKGKGLVEGMHPGCREADEMIRLVQRA